LPFEPKQLKEKEKRKPTGGGERRDKEEGGM